MPDRTAFSDIGYDVVVIGAGVVGCAVARRFTLAGARVLVVEKGPDLLEGASKGNSAILHTGFDAPVGSIEWQCIREGYVEFHEIRKRLDLPVERRGALVVAWTDEQEEKLASIFTHARQNQVEDVRHLGKKALVDIAPNLSEEARAAVLIPGESLLDPWSTPYAYMLQAVENGAAFARHCEVIRGDMDGERWTLDTSRGVVKTRWVVNCAGLYGDRVEALLLGAASFQIRPRKGQFLVFDKSAAPLVDHILLPVPTKKSKGIVICGTVFGNVMVGPTAEDQESRSDASVNSETLTMLRNTAVKQLPPLACHDTTAVFAGIRPATDQTDYHLHCDRQNQYLVAGGIRSTGLSSALGIASRLFRMYQNAGAVHQPPQTVQWPRVQMIAESGDRAWKQPGNGGIVCHCELVCRREIDQALGGRLPVGSLAGLKRRTRVTMGRCQGFYCTGRLTELVSGRLDQTDADNTEDD